MTPEEFVAAARLEFPELSSELDENAGLFYLQVGSLFRTSPARAVIDRAISELVENQDLVEGTLRPYIVGYILKQLLDAGVVGRLQG